MFIDSILGQIPFPLREKEEEMLKRFFQDEAGASSVEYCFLVMLIAVVIITAVTTMGADLSSVFSSAATSLGS
jgi:pilus assembly protein Flp/PilA